MQKLSKSPKILKLDEVELYAQCPMRWKIKRILQKDVEKQKPFAHYADSLRSGAFRYFKPQLYGEGPPTLKVVQEAFVRKLQDDEDVWKKILRCRGRSYKISSDSRLVEGLKTMDKFYAREKKIPSIVKLVDQEVSLEMGDFTIQGRIDLVRQVNGVTQLVHYDRISYGRAPGMFLIDPHLLFSVYAFRQKYGREDQVIRGHIGDKDDVLALGTAELARFEKATLNILDGIAHDRLYYGFSDQCTRCPYTRICTQYKL